MAVILEDAPGGTKQISITSDALTGPLQRYLLPQLTPDAVIVLRTTCKTLHQLITTAPFVALQRTLQTLLPPGVKQCATDSQSMRALLKVQRDLRQSLQAGAEARLQLLSLLDLETPWEYPWDRATSPHWVLESPCRRLVLELSNEVDNIDQVLMDPCDLLASLSRPAASQFSQEDDPFVTFLKGGALVEDGSGLAILDMDTQELTSTWTCPDAESCLDCQAGLDSGLICVNASTHMSSSDWGWHTTSVAVLKQCSLEELLVITPPTEPCQDGQAASRHPAAVTCTWVQPSPDQQHIGLWWSDATDPSCSRLCIYSLLDKELVADIDCQAVFGASAVDRYHAEWSPDSMHILFPRFQYSRSQHLPLGIMIADISGSWRTLATSLTWPNHVSSWSANGQYIFIKSSKSRPDQTQYAGSVWRAQTGEEVVSWEAPAGACCGVWSPVSSSIFLPDLTLMTLPAGGSSAEIIRRPYHGPQCFKTGLQGSSFKFSPSGNTLVGAWHTGVGHFPLQLPQGLWHADCSEDCAPSSMKSVAADTSGWLMESVLWNPSPWASHVYAILTGGGSLHLIDAAQHRSLRSWSCTELANSAGQHLEDSFRLSWSPDGSQLLALGCGCVSLLTFGPAVSNAPEDA